ncbi:hypothetical protein T440DRAFT_479958 [Plenodomus tracheiphilus IPT5]|uniref:Uncharacterized protein n=1 Tax=Plenodomus tracheiphilus IPT5 TaxID=1408161 RepID=A0A6A7B2R1_9PLEO|nr:hypothetical protein T440DRAFT_479958 [Plenodomus tracheiphilus IPT5]
MSTRSRRSMTSSGSGRQRRQAKLVVRRSLSSTPSPLQLPSAAHISQDVSALSQTPHTQLSLHDSPALLPQYSLAQTSRSSPGGLRPPHLDRATRQRLESQVHHILQRLGENELKGDASHEYGNDKAPGSASTGSRERLELELDQLLQCLHECQAEQEGPYLLPEEPRVGKLFVPEDELHSEPSVAQNEQPPELVVAQDGNRAEQDESYMAHDGNHTALGEVEAETTLAHSASVRIASNAIAEYRVHRSPHRFFTESPQLQNRFNTLVRKASQLSALSTAEIYMVVRGEGHFYVYNSVAKGSHCAPEPQPDEIVVCVAMEDAES